MVVCALIVWVKGMAVQRRGSFGRQLECKVV